MDMDIDSQNYDSENNDGTGNTMIENETMQVMMTTMMNGNNNNRTGNIMNGNETMQVTTTTNNNFSTYEKKTTACQQCKQTFYIDELKECAFSKIEWRKWIDRKKSNISQSEKYMVCTRCLKDTECITCRCKPNSVYYCDKHHHLETSIMEFDYIKWKCVECIKDASKKRTERK